MSQIWSFLLIIAATALIQALSALTWLLQTSKHIILLLYTELRGTNVGCLSDISPISFYLFSKTYKDLGDPHPSTCFVSLLSVLCTLCPGSANNTKVHVILPTHHVASCFLAFAHAVSSGWDAVSLFVQLVNSSLAFKILLRLFYIRKSFPELTPGKWITYSSVLLLELVHASITACVTFYYKYWFSCLSSLLDCELSWARSILLFSVSSLNWCLINVCWMND